MEAGRQAGSDAVNNFDCQRHQRARRRAAGAAHLAKSIPVLRGANHDSAPDSSSLFLLSAPSRLLQPPRESESESGFTQSSSLAFKFISLPGWKDAAAAVAAGEHSLVAAK